MHNLTLLKLCKLHLNVLTQRSKIMFKENFIRLCNERGEYPSAVCKKVGITPAAFSQWTEDTVPRKTTLVKVADYFGVSVSYLLGVVDDPNPIALIDPTKKDPPLLRLAEEASRQAEALAALSGLVDQLTNEQVEELRKYAEFLASKNKNPLP